MIKFIAKTDNIIFHCLIIHSIRTSCVYIVHGNSHALK